MGSSTDLEFVPGANFHEYQIIYNIYIIWVYLAFQLPYNSTYKYTYNLYYNAVALVGGGYFLYKSRRKFDTYQNLTNHKT